MHVINVGGMLPYRAHVEFFCLEKIESQCKMPYPGQLTGYSPTQVTKTVLAGTKHDKLKQISTNQI